jgi:Homoserine dehydrogenase, NAD binding domain
VLDRNLASPVARFAVVHEARVALEFGAKDKHPPFRFGDNGTMTGLKRDVISNSATAGEREVRAQNCNVALVGFGTVGSSVARILCERSNTHLRLTHILNRNVARKKVGWLPPSVQWTENIDDVLSSDVDIVVDAASTNTKLMHNSTRLIVSSVVRANGGNIKKRDAVNCCSRLHSTPPVNAMGILRQLSSEALRRNRSRLSEG